MVLAAPLGLPGPQAPGAGGLSRYLGRPRAGTPCTTAKATSLGVPGPRLSLLSRPLTGPLGPQPHEAPGSGGIRYSGRQTRFGRYVGWDYTELFVDLLNDVDKYFLAFQF